jgi:hypothetical protein
MFGGRDPRRGRLKVERRTFLRRHDVEHFAGTLRLTAPKCRSRQMKSDENSKLNIFTTTNFRSFRIGRFETRSVKEDRQVHLCANIYCMFVNRTK